MAPSGADLDPHYRDDGIRLLLTLKVPDFDRRFAEPHPTRWQIAADPSAALLEMEQFLAVQPEFWPALFLKAMGKKRLGDEEHWRSIASRICCVSAQVNRTPSTRWLNCSPPAATRSVRSSASKTRSRTVRTTPQLFAAMARYLDGLGSHANEARVSESRTLSNSRRTTATINSRTFASGNAWR